MNRRTWKEFITKRSTIWTLSLCLVGAIVLGGIAAVNSSRKGDDTQTETGTGQVAYLEEDLDSTDDENSISTDAANEADSILTDGTDAGDSILTDADVSDTGDSILTDADVSDADDSILADADGTNADSSIPADAADTDDNIQADTTDPLKEASGTALEENTSDTQSENTTSASADTAAGSVDTDEDSSEASSTNILSEQALLEAGVSFTDDQSLLWPSAGTIAIDYSMDKSVYFATLNQYKYNPALVISSETGNQVLASARGIVESITIDEETGTTLVLNIGNGYKLTYGQLMEPAVSEGDVVEAGDLLAYISEPTKYYSTEGSNLYFAMTKDGEPVDPVLYLE